MPSPDYIFQVPDGFEVVYTKTEIGPGLRAQYSYIDKLVAELWEHYWKSSLSEKAQNESA